MGLLQMTDLGLHSVSSRAFISTSSLHFFAASFSTTLHTMSFIHESRSGINGRKLHALRTFDMPSLIPCRMLSRPPAILAWNFLVASECARGSHPPKSGIGSGSGAMLIECVGGGSAGLGGAGLSEHPVLPQRISGRGNACP